MIIRGRAEVCRLWHLACLSLSAAPTAKCCSGKRACWVPGSTSYRTSHDAASYEATAMQARMQNKLDSARLTLVSVSAKHWLSLYIAPPAGLHGAPYCGQPGGAAVPGGPRCQERPGSRSRGSGVPGESGLEAAEGLVVGVSLQPRSCELPVFVLPARITPKACSPDTLPTYDPASSLINRR